MAKGVQLTEDQWRAALVEAIRQPEDRGMTVGELAAETGESARAIQRRLMPRVKAGEWVQGWAVRTDTLGRKQRVPVYRLNERAKDGRPNPV